MEKIIIDVNMGNQRVNFEVIDYPHHDNEKCKFEVFKDEQFVASFEPDTHGILHVCKNPGHIDNITLHTLAEKIESYNL